MVYYRSQTKFAKVMFLQVSVCPHGGGARVVAPGEEVCVVAARVACVVAPGGAWLLLGRACFIAPGGGVWLLPGGKACVVAPGGCVWLLQGGACMGYNEIRRYDK